MTAGGFDRAAIGRAVSYPGIDPRQWGTLATVDPDTPEAPSTRFKDEQGNPLPTGPLVSVTLQPSGIQTVCRVASFIAGIGEGSWYPFQQGDEVVVMLPQGAEGGSPVIIGRLNQEIDVWPQVVAGQDASENKFGFWRLRAPFVVESAEAFIIRSAKTGSQIGIDGTGQVILNNGDRNNLFIGSDAINLGDGDQDNFLQLNFNEQRFTVGVGSLKSRFELSAVGESQLFCAGTLNLGTSGARGKGNGITAQQCMMMILNVISQAATLGAFGPTSPWSIGAWPGVAIGALNAIVAAVLPASVTPVPIGTGGLPGGSTASIPGFATTFGAAMTAPLPITDPTGLILGPGRAGLFL